MARTISVSEHAFSSVVCRDIVHRPSDRDFLFFFFQIKGGNLLQIVLYPV